MTTTITLRDRILSTVPGIDPKGPRGARRATPAISVLAAWLCLGSCTAPQPQAPDHVLPPEWEAHEAVWFSYGYLATDTVLDKLLLDLDPATLAVCVVDGDSLAAVLKARLDSLGIAPHRYRIEPVVDSLEAPVVRDVGPLFLRRADGGLAVLDAAWNYYGDTANLINASAAQRALADSLPSLFARRLGLPVVQSPLVIEGGACEINGRSDLLQVEAVTLHRNAGWSRDSIEHELKRVLGAQRVIWLQHGPADDLWAFEPRVHGDVFNQGTGGHVDEFCRFVNDSTVLLCWPDAEEQDSVAALTRRRMVINERILKKAGLHVVRVPTPVAEHHPHRVDSTRRYDRLVLLARYPDLHHGDTIRYIHAASYLNFLLTNGRVYVPAYWHEGLPAAMRAKDERMQAILRTHFPDRRVVPIDPRPINQYGGGVHCWTQQQPRVKR
ncbi:MAG: agmatine deiminase family protein [Flavobacteriales bacterium]